MRPFACISLSLFDCSFLAPFRALPRAGPSRRVQIFSARAVLGFGEAGMAMQLDLEKKGIFRGKGLLPKYGGGQCGVCVFNAY